MMNIDTQGAELMVFKGATEVFKEDKRYQL